MKYLILQTFTSFGRTLEKGTVVDSTLVRSPQLRMSEGKIVVAVSSSKVPIEPELKAEVLLVTQADSKKILTKKEIGG